MAFNITSFFIGQSLAKSKGLDAAAANRIALLTTFMPKGPSGLLLANILAEREAEKKRSTPGPVPGGEDGADSGGNLLTLPNITGQRAPGNLPGQQSGGENTPSEEALELISGAKKTQQES